MMRKLEKDVLASYKGGPFQAMQFIHTCTNLKLFCKYKLLSYNLIVLEFIYTFLHTHHHEFAYGG